MNAKTTGFASPALGYEVDAIDLNSLLIHNPPATYYMRLVSSEMAALGLPEGSLLIVDRSIPPAINSFVLIRHEGQFLCRMFTKQGNKPIFTNGKEETNPTEETEIIGVITASIKTYDHAY